MGNIHNLMIVGGRNMKILLYKYYYKEVISCRHVHLCFKWESHARMGKRSAKRETDDIYSKSRARGINRCAWSFVDANDLPSFSRFFRRLSVIKTCLLMNIISAAGKLALTRRSASGYVTARKGFDGLAFGRINFVRAPLPARRWRKAQRGGPRRVLIRYLIDGSDFRDLDPPLFWRGWVETIDPPFKHPPVLEPAISLTAAKIHVFPRLKLR